MSVENALAIGVSREARSCAALRAAPSGLRWARSIATRSGVGDRACSAGQRAHGEQHALDVGMRDDRARAGWRAIGAALPAFARIGERLLGRTLGDRDPLQAHRKPRLVHHGEHAGHAAVLLADEEAGGAAAVAVDHGAGGRGVNAELVLDRMRARVVALPGRAVGVEQEFRHEEQRNALGSRRRVGQPRQHEMDDVVGEIVLAVGDEDLLAGDAIAAVGCALGLGAQRADVGAGLRLGELHGAHPFAGDELGQIGALELVAAMGRRARRCRPW